MEVFDDSTTSSYLEEYDSDYQEEDMQSMREFKLLRTPNSLKNIFDLFQMGQKRVTSQGMFLPEQEDHEVREERDLIWITDHAFVRNRPFDPILFQHMRDKFYFKLDLYSNTTDENTRSLYVFATTLKQALHGLNFLFRLRDVDFKCMWLHYQHDQQQDNEEEQDEEEQEKENCLNVSVLQAILLQNAKRQNIFRNLHFDCSQSRLLAKFGQRTDLGFLECTFENSGDFFWQACQERSNAGVAAASAGAAKLRWMRCFPMGRNNNNDTPQSNLSDCNFELLWLEDITLDSAQSQALALATIRCVKFYRCQLGDGGEALVRSVRAGRGPKGYCFTSMGIQGGGPFDPSERFTCLLEALHGNSYLETLEIHSLPEFPMALAVAIGANRGLGHFGCPYSCFRTSKTWNGLLAAVATHPRLRTLDLRGLQFREQAESEAYQALGDMLTSNHCLEDITVERAISDSVDWKTRISPKLEWNKYQTRFQQFQETAVSSTRAALVARALAHVNDNPSLIFGLVSQNGDILVSNYLSAFNRAAAAAVVAAAADKCTTDNCTDCFYMTCGVSHQEQSAWRHDTLSSALNLQTFKEIQDCTKADKKKALVRGAWQLLGKKKPQARSQKSTWNMFETLGI